MANEEVTFRGVARIHYEIDDDLHRRAKAQAAYRGMTLKEYVEKAISAAVDADEKEGKR